VTAGVFAHPSPTGARVTAVGYSEENVFTLESNDPTLPLGALVAEHGLESFRDYHARATGVQDLHRSVPGPVTAP
jgi:hypothetical protein